MSTKIVSALAILLVVGGGLLAIWQRVAPTADSTAMPGSDDGAVLPGFGLVLPLVALFVVFVLLAGVTVLFRGRGRHHR